MKKFLFTFVLMLSTMAVWAQATTGNHWSAPTQQDGNMATLVVCQVFINGAEAQSGLELAAFVGDECRADQTTASVSSKTGNYLYNLRVIGKTGESSATITFKAYYNGIEYLFTKSLSAIDLTVENGTYTTIPVVLNLDVITGISMTTPAEVTVKKADLADGKEVDFSDKITYQYASSASGGTAGRGATYTPLNESSPIGSYSLTLSAGQTSTDYLEISGTKATIKKVTDEAIQQDATDTYYIYASLGYTATGARQATEVATAQSELQVKYEKTLMTKLMYKGSTDSFTIDRFYAYEDLIALLTQNITFEPADPDFPYWKLEPVTKDGKPYGDISIPVEGGEYTFTIMPETAADGCVYPKDCKVKVYVRPVAIFKPQDVVEPINLMVGDDIKDATTKYVNFTWPNDDDPGEWAAKDLECTYSPAEAVNASGIVVKTGIVIATAKLKDGVTKLPTSQELGTSQLQFKFSVASALALEWSKQKSDFYKTGSACEDVFATVTVTNLSGETFDPESVIVKFPTNRYDNGDYPYAKMSGITKASEDAQAGTTTYNVYIHPLYVGVDIPFEFTYNSEPFSPSDQSSAVISITEKQALAAGWNWIALNSYKANGIKVEDACTMDDIIEGRAQLQLFYNDASLGLFGDLAEFSSAGGTYKIRTSKATSLVLGNQNAFNNQTGASATIKKGYNWIGNPFEFDFNLDRLPEFLTRSFTPSEGDKIMTQTNGYAEYSDGQWTGSSNFKLEAGRGIIYYSTSATTSEITFDHTLTPTIEDGNIKERSATRKTNIFTYDPYAFADNMAMVAQLTGLQNPDQYIIGVFVGDECRGNGSAVKGNVFFINATGKSGEKMTFKLYDTLSGETIDMDYLDSFGPVKGSIKNPVTMSVPAATGIDQAKPEVRSEKLGVDPEHVEGRSVNLAGQVVDGSYKGVVIKNGKKVIVK